MAKSKLVIESEYAGSDGLSLHNRLIIPILLRWWESLFGLGVELPSVGNMYARLLQLIAETQGDVSDEVTQTLKNVSTGLAFVAYDGFAEWQKVEFVRDVRRRGAYEGIDRVVLTPSQVKILQHVAKVVNIPYDPAQTEFVFTEIERKRPKYMDAWEKKQRRW